MRILYQIRPGFDKGASGDGIQMMKTMECLRGRGLEIKVSSSFQENLAVYDIIHIFNVNRVSEAYGFYKAAVAQKKRIVVSPVFLDMQQYYGNAGGMHLAAWRSANLLRREILDGADMLLPNSHREAKWIQDILCVDTPYQVVYNGVDSYMAEGDGERFKKAYHLKEYILCAGRLSPLKNQLGLIRAVKGLTIPLVLVGPVNDRSYARRCAAEAEGRVRYIPEMTQQELADAYRGARVHVQPSYFETAGLASLEAAAAGCPPVVTRQGAACEYFEDRVSYIDPYNIASITLEVKKAAETPVSSDLQRYILSEFTWQHAADSTAKAYQAVMEAPMSKLHTNELLYAREYPFPTQYNKAVDHDGLE